MAVSVAVMPGQLVGVGQFGRCQTVDRFLETVDRFLEIGHDTRFVFDGGQGTGGTHHESRHSAIDDVVTRNTVRQLVGDIN